MKLERVKMAICNECEKRHKKRRTYPLAHWNFSPPNSGMKKAIESTYTGHKNTMCKSCLRDNVKELEGLGLNATRSENKRLASLKKMLREPFPRKV